MERTQGIAAWLLCATLGAHAAASELHGTRAAWARQESDAGAVNGARRLTHLTAILNRSPERQRAFEELLRAQVDPASPEFHRWLTPTEVGERFGATPEDIAKVAGWLRGQGLQVDGISQSRTRIRFSGTADALGAAFSAPLHSYVVGKELRISPAVEPSVPAEISALVGAIHGLQTVVDKPHIAEGPVAYKPGSSVAKGSICSASSCKYYIWPGDFAIIYDVNPVLQQANGTGQTIAILGRSRVYMPDIDNFQARANSAFREPVTIVPPDGIDPGDPASTDSPTKEQSEATLDVTRAGSVAPSANILLVVSADSDTVGGLETAGEYVVDTTPVPARIMSISFGACESDAGSAAVAFWDSLFSQAAAEGISAFVSSGDSGVAGCDDHHVAPPSTPGVASPNYLCSSSYATCVGGTQFVDVAGFYWNTSNSTGHVSARGYIPEGAWNEPMDSTGAFQVAATGGGVSAFVPTPYWQVGNGVPAARLGRYTPDVSFSAAGHDPYARCFAAGGGDCVLDSSGGFHFSTGSGTSASTPSMAGIAALLNQKMGAPQGNLNPQLYALANSFGGNRIFHDVTIPSSGVSACATSSASLCDNSTPSPTAVTGGTAGYAVGPGYDLATGLGSIDVGVLFPSWNTVANPSPSFNYQGLWWASPAGSESGWGINFAHQGDTIFATWFTYDAAGNGTWLVMTAPKTGNATYAGTLYATTGPAFSAVPFDPHQVVATAAGNATLKFADSSNGTFTYTVGSVSKSKAITREKFGTIPTCAPSSNPSGARNYTDLWWASPAGSESGWGINLTHEDNTVFASWFTYDSGNKPMWLVVTATLNLASAYAGPLYRTTGPPLGAVFDPGSVVATQVGTATFNFSDGNHAVFAYTVNGVSQSKPITRQVFGTTGTVCR